MKIVNSTQKAKRKQYIGNDINSNVLAMMTNIADISSQAKSSKNIFIKQHSHRTETDINQ